MDLSAPLQHALTILRQGRYEEAIALYEQCINHTPDDLLAYWYLGVAWVLQGETDHAQSIWLAAIADHTPDDADEWMADLLQVLDTEAAWQLTQNHLSLAIALDQQRLELDGDQVEVCTRLAHTLAKLGQLDQAIAYWQQAAELQPGLTTAHLAVGQIWQRLGQYNDAIAAYTRVVEQHPEQAGVWYQLGLCLINTQEFDQAIAWFQRVIQQQPSFSPAYGDAAYSLLQQGKLEAAIALLRQMAQVEPTLPQHYCSWVNQAEKMSDSLRTNAAFFQAISNPADPESLYPILGKLCVRTGDFNIAGLVYQHAIQQQPNDVESYLELGKVLTKFNHVNEAIALYQTVIEQDADSVISYLELGKAFAKIGEIDQAIEAYQTALQIHPHLPDAYIQLGHLYADRVQIKPAIDCYQTALRLSPNSIELYLKLGITYAQAGDEAEAIACFKQVLQLNSNTAEIIWTILHDLMQQNRLTPTSTDLQQIMPIDPPRSFYASTKAWAIANSLEATHYSLIAPPHTISLTPPHTLESDIHFSFRFGDGIELPESFVVTIPEGRYWIDPDQTATAIITADQSLLFDLSPDSPILSPGHPDKTGDRHSLITTAKLQPPQKIEGTVVVLSALSNDMYFHWICDVLPRIQLLKLAGIEFDTVDYVLVSQHLPFQKETLNLLGIPDSKILEPQDYQHIQASQLIVPSFSGAVAWMSKSAYEFIRTVFLNKLPHPIHQPTRKIYISRRYATTRRVINEAEILALLEPMGFESVVFETLSVLEQIALMTEAAVVIAPHGSGLTNLIFCQPGIKVIELFSPDYIYPCYWYLANLAGLDYFYLSGKMPEGTALHKLLYPNSRLEDIWIDLAEMSNILQLANIISEA